MHATFTLNGGLLDVNILPLFNNLVQSQGSILLTQLGSRYEHLAPAAHRQLLKDLDGVLWMSRGSISEIFKSHVLEVHKDLSIVYQHRLAI